MGRTSSYTLGLWTAAMIQTLLTWGKEQKATWRWLRSQFEEAHGVLWPQPATPLPGFISSSSIDKLKADNAGFLEGSSIYSEG
ncbi:hypothetical protein [Neokomagataea anthophila]|uniref:Uncharacterized protein n=1 Tax=Neokomagataea anthophila TaxID=2826925 RepID=A0ABS5E7A8_9PROT|nr:hypothetical protein [Neokomagataea anthophila]MBR0559797.1 hypothetical protein [Neokomagataea anthophila]